ncbi:MAG: SDR family oxidoreductase [Acidimicrobiales bacterium]|nr:SDR family oxidoreductase [Acidimicrobiales bacterium]HRW37260.1 SDR family oxidoreductase [Aquihabitans sp.]
MDLGIEGRRAVVPAASAGLGLAAAQALASAGVHVAICGRDGDRVAAAVEALAPVAAGDHVGLVADVGSTEGAGSFVVRAAEALGGVDILVPNAGGPPAGTFGSTPLEAYLPALELNLLSTVAMCHAAVPAMVEQGWGRVVAITSVSVRQPISNLILSNTARAGATGFLKTLATEVARHGVTVNSVQPGLHATDRLVSLHGGDTSGVAASVPAGVIGRPEDFGAVVAFLASEHARFLTGAAVPVDGGASGGLQ